MTRWLYSCVLWLAQPLLRRKLARRGVLEPGYLHAVEQRFGYYSADVPKNEDEGSAGWVWVHAVSLGETRAAAILVHALRQQMPGMRLLLTHGTATGRAEGQTLLAPGDMQVWQPWDTPSAVRRFLTQFRPAGGFLMETEVWPNMVAICRLQGVPLVLANARLNARSLARAQRLGWLARPAFAGLAAVWAQSEDDAARLLHLGAPVRGVLGNIKFDAMPNPTHLAQGQAWRPPQPVLLLASAREGEEAELLEILKRLMPVTTTTQALPAINNDKPSVQWLIVPRHPQRFDAIAALVQQQGFTLSRRSSWLPGTPPPAADIWLGDSLGEMALYYSLAQAALLGGSFAPLGGQNLIEAAACGCPVFMGPSVFNFAQAAAQAQQAGAAWGNASMAQAVQQAIDLVNQPERQAHASAAATQFAAAHQGAAQKTAEAVLALRISQAAYRSSPLK